MSTNAALVGATGLVGANMLQVILTHPGFASVSAFARKPLSPSDPNGRLRPVQEKDSAKWAAEFASISPSPSVFYSGLGTTRGNAGGLDKQRAIDFDLNLAMAKAAKEAGCRVYVLISSAGSNSGSMMPYPKMKGELEEAVSNIGFEKTVLLRPGLICGAREETRMAEGIFRRVANAMGSVSGNRLKDFWAQDAAVIARAAVVAGQKCLEGTAPEGKTWLLTQADIVRMGRTEWKE